MQTGFFGKLVMENFSNFSIRCPFKASESNVAINNIKFSGQFVPPFVNDFKYCVDFTVKACFKNEKKFVNVAQGRSWVRFKRE